MWSYYLAILSFAITNISMNDTACPKNQMLSLYVGFDTNNFTYVKKSTELFLEIYLHYLGVICYGRWVLSEGHKNYFKDWCLMNWQPTFLFLTNLNLKLVFAIFIKFLFFHLMIALQMLWKMLFISSKELFSFSRYSIFFISVLPSFFTCQPLLWRMIEDKS